MAGLVLFVWLQQKYRWDRQEGFNCQIFRNESARRSSDIILEAEAIVLDAWGPNRLWTYIDPACVQSVNPGYCFKCAGWRKCGQTQSGKVILEKRVNL